MAFGANPVTTTQGALAANQLYASSVAVPGHANGDFTAVKGGVASTDSNGNEEAAVATYTYDGEDVTQGLKADSAATDSTSSWSVIALLKGILGNILSGLKIILPTSATGTLTSVAGTTTASTQLLAANTSRKGMYIYNESTAILYLGFSATVTTSSYTLQISAGGFFEMPPAPVYTGVIAGVWSAANGNARITQLT